jgi:RNA polymerase II subunit A small phosphatase-like protein
VLKRPGVDEFIRKVCEKYEVVVFTASLAKVRSAATSAAPARLIVVARHTVRRPFAGHAGPAAVDEVSPLPRGVRAALRQLRQGAPPRAPLSARALTTHCATQDLSRLGRDLSQTLIIDNSPFSYMFQVRCVSWALTATALIIRRPQPDNAIPISSWFSDQNDRQLYEIIPILDTLLDVDDVCAALASKDIQLPQGDPAQG